jgi:nicotinamidase-related amidase
MGTAHGGPSGPGPDDALLVVDYTYDFVADDGRLSCGAPAQALDDFIADRVAEFAARGRPVLCALDLHEAEDPLHPEARLFPPHNLRGTPGRELYGRVGATVARLVREGAPLRRMDKTRYSAFAGTDLDLWLRARGVRRLWLTGVCTDICVLHTAVDAYNLGYRLVVPRAGVASFDPAGHAWALGHFRSVLGAEVP